MSLIVEIKQKLGPDTQARRALRHLARVRRPQLTRDVAAAIGVESGYASRALQELLGLGYVRASGKGGRGGLRLWVISHELGHELDAALNGRAPSAMGV